jgi:NDP-sugar pyrophosphorylase family protein
MKAIILAAGSSTRTFPLTVTRPKPLLPLMNGTVLDYTLGLLRDMNVIDEVILVVNYKKEMIMNRYGDSFKGMRITYVNQDEPMGTGHAVMVTEDLFNSMSDTSVLIMNGDDIFSREDVAKVLEKYPAIAVKEVIDPKKFGVFEFKKEDAKLIATSLEEKPENPKSNLANVGIYHFGIDFFKYLHKVKPSRRGELEITDAIRRYIDWNDIRLIKIHEHWLPIGYPWDLLSANEFLMTLANKMPRPIVDDSVRMKESVEIVGASIIGKDVTLGENVYIKNSIIMDGVTIGADSVIKDSIIGENTVIEKECEIISETANKMYSKIKDEYVVINRSKFGCVIGDNVEIAKKATIHPGVKIWPNVSIQNKRDIKEDILE